MKLQFRRPVSEDFPEKPSNAVRVKPVKGVPIPIHRGDKAKRLKDLRKAHQGGDKLATAKLAHLYKAAGADKKAKQMARDAETAGYRTVESYDPGLVSFLEDVRENLSLESADRALAEACACDKKELDEKVPAEVLAASRAASSHNGLHGFAKAGLDPNQHRDNLMAAHKHALKTAEEDPSGPEKFPPHLRKNLIRHHHIELTKAKKLPIHREDEGLLGGIAGAVLGGAVGGIPGAVAGGYLGHKATDKDDDEPEEKPEA